MMTYLLPCLALVLAQDPAPKLEIVNPRSTYGHLGAVRPKKVGVLPGDLLHFTFEIKNLKLDANGQALYTLAIRVRDDKGDITYEQKPYNAVAQNCFGGNSLPASAHMEIPLTAAPGERHATVTITDRITKQVAVLKGKGTVLPADFGLVRVGTYADAEGKVPVPPVGVVGGLLYVNFSTVGFGRDDKTKQPDLFVKLRVLDENGKPTFAKPLTGHVKDDIPQSLRVIPLQFGLTMNRPGQFTVELTAECRHCGKTSTIRFPVRILPLEGI